MCFPLLAIGGPARGAWGPHFATCPLGSERAGAPVTAVALAVVTSALLAYEQPLHGIVDRIGVADLYAAIKLLIASFIVLPLLPDRTVDPWYALNLYKLWLLVIMISGLSLVGYVAMRWLGNTRRDRLFRGVALPRRIERRAGRFGRRTIKNPFSLGSAIRFGVLFAAVLLGVTLAQQYWPGVGVIPIAMLAGSVDVDAISLTIAEQTRANEKLAEAVAITAAALANTAVKFGFVAALGGSGFT